MPTSQKAKVIEKTKERYDKSVGVIFTEYRGLSVPALQDLRKSLKEKGGEMQVVKNTLFVRAIGDAAESLPEEYTSGPTAIAFLYENEAECAKVLADFSGTNKNLVIKGGLIDGKVFDENQVEALSKLPPREVLIAQVVGAIAAPLSMLVGTIEALYATPIRTIGAVADKVSEGGGPVEAKAEETAEASAEAPAAEAQTEESAPAEEASAPTESQETTEETSPEEQEQN